MFFSVSDTGILGLKEKSECSQQESNQKRVCTFSVKAMPLQFHRQIHSFILKSAIHEFNKNVIDRLK